MLKTIVEDWLGLAKVRSKAELALDTALSAWDAVADMTVEGARVTERLDQLEEELAEARDELSALQARAGETVWINPDATEVQS